MQERKHPLIRLLQRLIEPFRKTPVYVFKGVDYGNAVEFEKALSVLSVPGMWHMMKPSDFPVGKPLKPIRIVPAVYYAASSPAP